MNTRKRTILVPWDFSEKAEFAVAHAKNVAQVTGNTITLLHIVKEESEIQDASVRLHLSAGELEQKYHVKPEFKVLKGNIFKTIGEAATDLNAEIIIMGTHGIKGMQKFLGSWALKVIVKAKVPFIVVQAPPSSDAYKNVVFPINYRKESKEKIRWSSFLSYYYHCKFHLFLQHVSDRGLKTMLHNNVTFTRKYLDNNNIEYEVAEAPGKDDFATETIEYARQVDADMILIITSRSIIFTGFVLGADEQKILANPARIPVMCVNPRPGKLAGGFSATGC